MVGPERRALRRLWLVASWTVGAAVLELGSAAAEPDSERFGRVVVMVALLAGLSSVARHPRLAAPAAAVVAAVAALAPATGTEIALSFAAVACSTALAVAGGLRLDAAMLAPTTPRHRDVPSDPHRSGLRGYGFALAAWLATAVVVNVVLSISGSAAGTLPDGRVVWDASNFISIARDGYRDLTLAASFPGYAMVIRAAHEWLGMDLELAAILISDLCGLAVALLFWRWTAGRLSAPARRLALVLVLWFPYSFVLFGVAYADGLLLALVLGALVAVDADRPVLAGLLAAYATFTRPNALVLIPALVALVAERSGIAELPPSSDDLSALARLRALRWHPERIRPRHLGALLPGLGIAGYMVWMQRLTGDPWYFWTVQTTQYGHRAFWRPATWAKVEFVNRPWAFIHNGPDAANQVVSLGIVLAALASLPAVVRRFGIGAALLGLGSVATLWVTASGFSPAGRYLLPYAPIVVALVAEPLVVRRGARVAVASVCAAGSLVLAAAFAAAFRLNW